MGFGINNLNRALFQSVAVAVVVVTVGSLLTGYAPTYKVNCSSDKRAHLPLEESVGRGVDT